MNNNLIPTPSEAYRVMKRSYPVDEILEISQYCDVKDILEPDRKWAHIKKLHAIFWAGYIAGVREARLRQRERK